MEKANYTSLKLSKKLNENGCKLESEWYWKQNLLFDDIKWRWYKIDEMILGKLNDTDKHFATHTNVAHYPAYDILNDICVKYAKEFFGGEELEDDEVDLEYSPITRQILSMLQERKPREEIENYIWENCKFNPNNK